MAYYMNFTIASIDKLPIRGKQYDVADTEIRGLSIRVNQSGSKTFNFFRRVNGKLIRQKLGRHPDLKLQKARNIASALNGQFALGENPLASQMELKKELTFEELYTLYYNNHGIVFTKRPDDNLKMIKLHVIPVFGSEKLSKITSENIRKMHLRIGTNAKAAANRVIEIMSATFNFGIKDNHFNGTNPCLGVRKFKTFSRDRFLSKEELSKFIKAAKQEDDLFRDYFMLLLHTGARKSNVLAMKYCDIDFDNNHWRIDASETKNNEVNIVLLSEASMKILKRRFKENEKLKIPSTFVFPGEGTTGHLQDPKKAFQRIKDRMKVQDIRIHDLRRTFGSYMAISGASLPMIGKALNHKSQTSTVIYARLAQSSVLDAINTATDFMFK